MESTGSMPVLFIGHGSPMNAIEHNEFTDGWRKMAETFPKPKAILCISAHWETNGTLVTSMAKPKTIHDFGGFPQKLYDVQYPAPGCPELAGEMQGMVTGVSVIPDDKWGMDHGAWGVIMQMYPDASVPVIQMSLDYRLSRLNKVETLSITNSYGETTDFGDSFCATCKNLRVICRHPTRTKSHSRFFICKES